MNIKSKAETLFYLSKKLKNFEVSEMFFFDVNDWKKDKDKIIKIIQKKFDRKEIIIRSSATDEDTLERSSAGKYLSFVAFGFSFLNAAVG